MTTVKLPIALVAAFLWIGFVCAISFMEAWLKFRAPGITLPLGLGIGRIVFNVLNKVEWVFVIAISLDFMFSRQPLLVPANIPYLVSLVLLIVQTMWLLPALDLRAELTIQGTPVQPSSLHFYYVAMEAVKIICLAVFGVSLFKSISI